MKTRVFFYREKGKDDELEFSFFQLCERSKEVRNLLISFLYHPTEDFDAGWPRVIDQGEFSRDDCLGLSAFFKSLAERAERAGRIHGDRKIGSDVVRNAEHARQISTEWLAWIHRAEAELGVRA